MLARGDNVSNVSRAFGCHRNTIIRLRQRFQQTGGVSDRRRPGRPRVTLTHLRRRRHGPAILMHDNARPHVARICRQFLNRNNVNVLPWPAVSPDMNPIEHIWAYLCRKVRARGNVHNLRDLENALIQEWNNIPNVVIRRYVRSMRGRLAACINSRGGHTRY